MCGICGYFNYRGIQKSPSLIQKMSYSLSHRGPDDSGYFIDDFCALGHTRLAIIDLEKGKQPMSDDDESIIVVFNGEIYNYLDLKEELKKFGYNFKTNSDTEVIIYAYKRWGNDFINRLNGMFAVAIYDRLNRKLLVVRDRIGLKPLYWTIYNGHFIFSSEPKGIFKFSDGIKREIDFDVLSMYLTSHNINLGDKTLYKNINLLEPGYFIVINGDSFLKYKYWDIEFSDQFSDINFLRDRLRKILDNSVNMRLISDVPLGSFLSGGVDSTVIISLIKEKFKENLKTFTIGFEKDGYNEFYFSDIVNRRFKTDNERIIFPEDEYFEILEDYLRIKEFPLNVPNELLIYYLSKYLKKYITVVISGEGADEIFGGYGIFLRSVHDYAKLFMINKIPDFFTSEINSFIKEKLKRQYNFLNFYRFEDFIYRIYSVFSWEEKKSLFKGDFLESDEPVINEINRNLPDEEGLTYYDRLFYFLEKLHLPGLLLRLDNASMAAGVEARAPFTDHNLVQFSFNIPFNYKIKWKDEKYQIDAVIENARTISENFDITKYILKESFKSEIPSEIYKRNKWSFPVPLNEFFNGKFKSYIKEKFSKKSIFYDIFDYKNVQNFITDLYFGNKGLKVWMLLNLKLWIDTFF